MAHPYKPLPEQFANSVFKVLVDTCRCHPSLREEFVRWATDPKPDRDFRFGGMFGMAGKIWLEVDGIRVSGPNRFELDEANNRDELELAVEQANKQLALLVELDPLVEISGDSLLPT